MVKLRNYVSGAFVEGDDGGDELLYNPTTEASIARASTKGIDLGATLDYARTVGGPALRAMTFAERGALLKTLSKALYEIRDALIDTSVECTGTTRSDAKFDIDGATGTLAYYASLGAKLGNKRVWAEDAGEQLGAKPRFWGHHVRSPRRGVAVHINAFNFPAWGMMEKAAMAILAGMPVVTKPAVPGALVAYRMIERIVERDLLPPGAMQFVCGAPQDLLERLGPQDVIAFTGSGKTGAVLRRLDSVTARGVHINVEADSVNACLLAPDVEVGSDLYAAFIRDTAKEIVQKSGQKCTATRRILVPRSIADAVCEELGERLRETKVGNPTLEEVRMGPVATKAQLASVREGIAALIAAGAKTVTGDPTRASFVGVDSGKGFFIEPHLLRIEESNRPHLVHEREVFGPVSAVLPYDTWSDALQTTARGEGSLVTTLYTDDRDALSNALEDLSPWSGRILAMSSKVVDQAIAPGMVLPSCVHGGPGRAGGGEELGGERGLALYMQRTSVQGDRAVLDKWTEG